MSTVLTRKKKLIEALKPGSNITWTSKEAAKFRQEYFSRVGKHLPFRSPYYPFSMFSDDQLDTENDKKVTNRFAEIIKGSMVQPEVQSALDDLYIQGAIGDLRLSHTKPVRTKMPALPPAKRRKLQGFKPKVLFVRDNTRVKNFELFMKTGVYSKLIILLNLSRANKNVSTVDQGIYSDARGFLESLYLQVNKQKEFLLSEIYREAKILSQYFRGERPPRLGVPSTNYIPISGMYASILAAGTSKQNVEKGKAARKAIIESKMIVFRYKLWKQWQEYARGLEERYKTALSEFENKEFISPNSAAASVLSPGINLIPRPKMPSQSITSKVLELKNKRLNRCKKHFDNTIKLWKEKVRTYIDIQDDVIDDAIDDLNKGARCDKNEHQFLQEDFDKAVSTIRALITEELKRREEIEKQEDEASAQQQAELKAQEQRRTQEALERTKQLEKENELKRVEEERVLEEQRRQLENERKEQERLKLAAKKLKEERKAKEMEEELKRKQLELKMEQERLELATKRAEEELKQNELKIQQQKEKELREKQQRELEIQQQKERELREQQQRDLQLKEEELQKEQEAQLKQEKERLVKLSQNIGDLDTGKMSKADLNKLDINEKLKKQRNPYTWRESYNDTSVTETYGKQRLNKDEDLGGRLITSRAVIFDTYFLESPYRQMTNLLLAVSDTGKFAKYLPRFVLLKNTDTTAKKYIINKNGDAPASEETGWSDFKSKWGKQKQAKKKRKQRQENIDKLYENQPEKNATFTIADGKIKFKALGANYDVSNDDHIDPQAKYILIQENCGVPLLDLVTYCYDSLELGEEDGETTRTLADQISNELDTHVYKGKYAYDINNVGKQLEEALREMKSLKFQHRDIKLDNVCLDDNGKLTFIDLERCITTAPSLSPSGTEKKGWKGDVFYLYNSTRNGNTSIDPPGISKCSGDDQFCDKYQSGLVLLSLGAQFDIVSDYKYSNPSEFLKKARKEFNVPVLTKENVKQFLTENRDNVDGFNLSKDFLAKVISNGWFYMIEDSTSGGGANGMSNRVTIEYDSMSEDDIAEIEKAMNMYSDELERYDSESDASFQKSSLYDSSSGVSEQKASHYDSSSDVSYQNNSSKYDSGSDVSFDKASYNSSSDSESPVGQSVSRVPYDSSSEIASETEMDYSLESESEYDDRSSDANVPYNSDSDMESI